MRRVPIIILLLLFFLGPPPGSLAQGPPEEERFRWVEEVEELSPREFPNRLSRPLPGYEMVTSLAPRADLTADFGHYLSSAEVVTFTGELEALYPDLVESYQVGTSWQGRPIMGVRLGNETTGNPEDRPALYLDGQHHAREPIAQQIVLYTLSYLASNYGSDPLVTHLLDTRTVYAIPSVNVDGNDIWLADDFSQRRTANPTASDDDTDGLFDEDPANDNGYGTYWVYRYDCDQKWADDHPNDPFAEGWQDHCPGSEYLGVFDDQGNEIPQLDDDNDGRINCDPVGGVDANRNYDIHWELGEGDPRSPGYHGPTVWSEPETRAVRDFIVAHQHIITGLSYHSGADLILHPWAWSGETELPDAFFYELLSRKGTQLTGFNGFTGSPHAWTARGLYAVSGSTMDWLYEQGIYAWSPESYGASAIAFTERIDLTGSFRVGLSPGVGMNPDQSDILPTVERWNRFNLYILAATPNVGLTSVSAEDGVLTLGVANDGYLPVELVVSVAGEGGFLASETVRYLQASERSLSIGYPTGPEVQIFVVTLTANSLTGTLGKEIEVEQVELRIEERHGPEGVTVLQGQVGEFMDLGSFFGEGRWLAPRRWDTPNVHHLGPPLLREMFLPMVSR